MVLADQAVNQGMHADVDDNPVFFAVAHPAGSVMNYFHFRTSLDDVRVGTNSCNHSMTSLRGYQSSSAWARLISAWCRSTSNPLRGIKITSLPMALAISSIVVTLPVPMLIISPRPVLGDSSARANASATSFT